MENLYRNYYLFLVFLFVVDFAYAKELKITYQNGNIYKIENWVGEKLSGISILFSPSCQKISE